MLTNAKHSELFHQIIAIQVQLFEVEPNDHDARHVKYLWLTFLFLFKKNHSCIHTHVSISQPEHGIRETLTMYLYL